jgi:hypothetical protein
MHAANRDDYLPPADKQYFGPGYVCQQLQIVPAALRVLMDNAGVRFAASLDGVPLLDLEGLDAVIKLHQQVAKALKDADGKMQAAPNN